MCICCYVLNICITFLLGEIQETVAARANSSLCYWLAVCRGGNRALSNNTQIKV